MRGAYSYEYIDDWKKINEISLPQKEDFHNPLNIEHLTEMDCTHAKRVCKDYEKSLVDTMICMFKVIHYC